MNADQRFAELWTDYLEGELSEDGIAELRKLLAADESLLKLAADLYQSHHLLGLIADEGRRDPNQFVEETLNRLPDTSDSFIGGVMSGISKLSDDGSSKTAGLPEIARSKPGGTASRTVFLAAGWLVAALLLLAVGIDSLRPAEQPKLPHSNDGSVPAASEPISEARFSSLADARFFGELQPPIDSAVPFEREYVLLSGLVELSFPEGATAILEGPTVFRVTANDCLALDVGRCSVHAPDGAEGFRVDTPVTKVVDRGTRFAVRVSETTETEVQVIEGAADVFRQPNDSTDGDAYAAEPTTTDFKVRLVDRQAQAFTNVGEFVADAVPFSSGVYQRGLPDRVISYRATSEVEGRAELLESVTVQRGGRVVEYPVGELIPIEVTSFCAPANTTCLASAGTLPADRVSTSSDRSLITGLINPGGSTEPLTTDPVIVGPEDSSDLATPGMTIRFRSPVVNGPGDDIVFFDLQTLGNPPDGDAFHVSPLKFRDGLKSHTIRIYDLTMESPAALRLREFQIHMFKGPVDSLATLQDSECGSRSAGRKFRGLVVGIDLSDLGFNNGEQVDELFIQDAMDNGDFVDPVFIAGLPSLTIAEDQ